MVNHTANTQIPLIGVAFMALQVASARGQLTEGSDDDRD